MVRHYIEIIRPSDCLMASFAVLIGFLVASGGFVVHDFLMFLKLFFGMIAVFLFAAAGIVINDYFDYHIDKINAPHRPLPSGKIKRGHSLNYSYLLFSLGIFFAFLVSYLSPGNPWCLFLALINTALEIYYARNFKRMLLIGNFVDSWFVASSFLFGALIFGYENLQAVSILALISFFANAGREVFGDIEDIAGDKKLGLKTLPIIYGEKIAKKIGSALILLAVIMSPLPWFFGLLKMPYLFAVLLADAIFLASLSVDPRKNQLLTKIAMVVALFAFVVGVI
ncbi:MAG: UbiA family prenyltransferase [Candidatus Diapherotrites archaeon]|nr:UbiA family prenyltransferase [Candidatus Diapherotrites archaeon]